MNYPETFFERVEAEVMETDAHPGSTAETLADDTMRIHPSSSEAMDGIVLAMDGIAHEMSDADHSLRYELEKIDDAGGGIYEVSHVRLADSGSPR